MAEEKKEKDANCDTSNQTGSCTREEKEVFPQETLEPARNRLRHRPGRCTIPEWMERWALGD
jgi:hypothetical protein